MRLGRGVRLCCGSERTYRGIQVKCTCQHIEHEWLSKILPTVESEYLAIQHRPLPGNLLSRERTEFVVPASVRCLHVGTLAGPFRYNLSKSSANVFKLSMAITYCESSHDTFLFDLRDCLEMMNALSACVHLEMLMLCHGMGCGCSQEEHERWLTCEDVNERQQTQHPSLERIDFQYIRSWHPDISELFHKMTVFESARFGICRAPARFPTIWNDYVSAIEHGYSDDLWLRSGYIDSDVDTDDTESLD